MGTSVQLLEYTKYFEDWTFDPNEGFGPMKGVSTASKGDALVRNEGAL
jgi:hypothetical protein